MSTESVIVDWQNDWGIIGDKKNLLENGSRNPFARPNGHQDVDFLDSIESYAHFLERVITGDESWDLGRKEGKNKEIKETCWKKNSKLKKEDWEEDEANVRKELGKNSASTWQERGNNKSKTKKDRERPKIALLR